MTRLLVIDTETGGVDPDRHSILSLAAVVWSDGRIEDEFEVLIAEPDITITPGALEVNRIDVAAHCRIASPPAKAFAQFQALIDVQFADELAAGGSIVLAGHNVSFDVGFLRRLCRLAGVSFPAFFSYRTLDTASVLRFLVLAGRLPVTAVSLNDGLAAMGLELPPEQRHTALGDARATAQLLTRFVGLVQSP